MQDEEETIDVQHQEEKPSKHGPRKCENPNCGKEFIPKNARAKYCSASCNAQASRLRLSNNVPSMPAMPSMNGLGALFAIPPHAQMMIDMNKKEADRWEKKYDEEVKEHKETRKKLETLKEEATSERNPGGLQGFAERNPEIASKLIDFGAMMASKFGDKLMTASPNVPAVAEAAGLTGQAADMVKIFADWLPKISEQSQVALWQLITALSNEDEERMNYIINSILQQWKR